MNDNTNIGIYKITNKKTGKFYIGSSNNLRKRKREHFWSLGKGTHINDYLQKSFNKHGKENFVFEVIECLLNDEDILSVEQRYLDSTDCCNRSVGYNINVYAGGGGLKGSNNPNFGKPMSQEQKNKISQSLKGQEYTIERRKKMSVGRKGKCVGSDNHNFNRVFTEEERKRQSDFMKGRYVGSKNPTARKVVQLDLEGNLLKIFDTVKEAATECETYSSSIINCCKGRYKKVKGFMWMYFDDYKNMI